jgi:hypothetical protein
MLDLDAKDIRISALDDFIDEEVVDTHGAPVGVLSCYWESTKGVLFLGVKPRDAEVARVVPGSLASLDERQSCVRIRAQASEIQSAPLLDCDNDLRGRVEDAANEHFGVEI